MLMMAMLLAGGLAARAQTAAPAALALQLQPGTAPVEANGAVQFIGTATVLIRYQGFTILTDPNFLHKGDHVHLVYGITSERLTNPALNLEQVPPIDLVVLSHMHEDHFDKLVQEKVDKNIPIVTTTARTACS